MRGQKPSWMACAVSENTPEITACEAITAAAIDSATNGNCIHAGAS